MRSMLQWNPFLFSFLLTLILLSASAAVEEEENSPECHADPEAVSLELVHRHDPRIPGNENLKLNKHEAIRDRVLVDMTRKGLGSMIQMPLRTGVEHKLVDYYVQVRVGTPPQSFWLIADTGSDLTWIKCNDEVKSLNDTRRSTLHVDGVVGFHRKASSTYQPIECSSPRCKSEDFSNFGADPSYCDHPKDYCTYQSAYAHGTIALGDFGTDVVTLGIKSEKEGKIEDLVIGCTYDMIFGSDNEGELFQLTDGILGLGYNPSSFLYRAANQYGNKFSYCLMDGTLTENTTNFLTFGSYETSQTQKATLIGPMKRTKLIITDEGDYGVQLEGISLGGQMLDIPSEMWDFKAGGGMTLDSGTSLTFVGKAALKPISEGLLKAIAPKFKIVDKKNSTGLATCFVVGEDDGWEKLVPKLGFHFADGVVFEPPLGNYVINLEDNLYCLGIGETRSPGAVALMGNLMQQFHLWEFDLAAMTLGFAPSQCTH